jgi:hypothetical protein
MILIKNNNANKAILTAIARRRKIFKYIKTTIVSSHAVFNFQLAFRIYVDLNQLYSRFQ